MSITNRQAKVLAAIVKEYSMNGKPVASRELVDKGYFDASPATIRNEMQVLEQNGYITHPHTSAGRIPTDEGFRFFVNKLMRHLELSNQQQQRLERELRKLQKQYLELGQSISRLLAKQAGGAAFALLPGGGSSAGLSNIIDESVKPSEVKEMAEFLENVSDYRDKLSTEDKVQAYIGRQAPVPLSPDFSLVITRVKLPRGEKGLIGIVGPKRMKYAKNISLLEYMKRLLGSGLPVVMLINLVQ